MKNNRRSSSLLRVTSMVCLVAGMVFPVWAENTWTLENSIKRVLNVAPESQAAVEMVEVRRTEAQQSEFWPNPEVEIRADESMGLDDGSDGFDLSSLSISQPIPLGRLASQKKQAEARMALTLAENKQQQLLLEYQAAMLFHELQLKSAYLDLSQQRLKMADQFGSKKSAARNADRLVRYLSPLEKKRLAILVESARQDAIHAEGEFNEAATRFRILLNLDAGVTPYVKSLELLSENHQLDALQKRLADHPKLQSAQQTVAVARAETEVAEQSRYKDPEVSLFVERDIFNSQRETYTGVAVNVEIPLWNENSSALSIARANMIRSKTDLEIQSRELKSQLQQSYMHYQHLLKQAKSYRKQLLKPAEEMFQLSRKSFAAGEQNILGLIDSHTTYFEVRKDYLSLLAAIGRELASLRLVAGISVMEKNSLALLQGDKQ